MGFNSAFKGLNHKLCPTIINTKQLTPNGFTGLLGVSAYLTKMYGKPMHSTFACHSNETTQSCCFLRRS
jgi:hypothetical protein